MDNSNPKDREGQRKPSLSLVPGSAIIHMAEAFKEGAKKYGAYNWRETKVNATVYLDAILRHTLAIIDGEDIDPESGKHHLDGVLASAAVYIDAMETGNLIDNRPTKGPSGKMIRDIASKNKLSSLLKGASEALNYTLGDKKGVKLHHININQLDDSRCLTMAEHHNKLKNDETYSKGYINKRNK